MINKRSSNAKLRKTSSEICHTIETFTTISVTIGYKCLIIYFIWYGITTFTKRRSSHTCSKITKLQQNKYLRNISSHSLFNERTLGLD